MIFFQNEGRDSCDMETLFLLSIGFLSPWLCFGHSPYTGTHVLAYHECDLLVLHEVAVLFSVSSTLGFNYPSSMKKRERTMISVNRTRKTESAVDSDASMWTCGVTF